MKNNYKPIIGLEVHVELSTKSKMFCGCPAQHFGIKPNTLTCPVCLGLPGALPVPNEKAVRDTIKIGLALNCEVERESKFDRKQYFYPDLPKGYQISQYDSPLATNGLLEMSNVKGQMSKVNIRRVHLEEDTGKLIHRKVDGKDVTLVDFNRSGVPLVEIVTEPDIRSSGEAKKVAQELQSLIRWLEVSDCDMEKGSMRLEANVSLQKLQNSLPADATRQALQAGKTPKLQKLPDYKVEVKNINSFKFMEKAINFEIERQSKLLQKADTPKQETRGWDEKTNTTKPQRFKETEADYRYFPEPDIPPMVFSGSLIDKIRKDIPELPHQLRTRFYKNYGLPKNYLNVLCSDKNLAQFAEKVLKLAKAEKIDFRQAAGYIVNNKISPKQKPKDIVQKLKAKKSSKVSDQKTVSKFVNQAVVENPQAVKDYKSGKVQALAAIIGKVMKVSHGKADPKVTRKILEQKLESTRE